MKSRRLIIAGQAWRVRWCRRPMVEGGKVFGWMDPAACIIHVSTMLSPDAERVTVLHEVIHAIHSTGADRHPRDEEPCVNAVSQGLFAIARNPENAWFLPYLIGGAP